MCHETIYQVLCHGGKGDLSLQLARRLCSGRYASAAGRTNASRGPLDVDLDPPHHDGAATPPTAGIHRCRWEPGIAQQPPLLIDHCGVMDQPVGVDPADDNPLRLRHV
jgi:hypothetical protein